ncbi:SecDF P1 head subdomain-containing protein [Streptacidiphilus sp. PAMC 29251]
MTDHVISEDELHRQLQADQGEAATVHLIGLADGALRQARHRQRVRTGFAALAVVAATATGVASSGWFGGTLLAGPAAPGSGTVVLAEQINFLPVTSSKPGACPPGGGYPSLDSPTVCYQLDKAKGLTATAPGAVVTRSAFTGGWMVELHLHGKDVAAFAALTGSLAEHPTGSDNELACVINGKVLSASTFTASITDGVTPLVGDFTQQSATTLADQLTGG